MTGERRCQIHGEADHPFCLALEDEINTQWAQKLDAELRHLLGNPPRVI